ncbi:hypothetical protein, partial [Ruminococcus sp.]|uniref:hypothetical protein n=1 Tax=Ruminococcus sp. TaxID=41978 RepID=UPI003FEEC783
EQRHWFLGFIVRNARIVPGGILCKSLYLEHMLHRTVWDGAETFWKYADSFEMRIWIPDA